MWGWCLVYRRPVLRNTAQVQADIERKAALITAAEGGTIKITETESPYSQGFEIVIPPGALPQDTKIVIKDRVANIPQSPTGLVPIGLPITLEPDGTIFKTPVTIKIHYTTEMLIYAGVTDPTNPAHPIDTGWRIEPVILANGGFMC